MENVVSKLYMTVLMQTDLKAGVAFYKKLGLKLAFELENKWAEFDLNGIKVGLCPAGTLEKGRYTGLVFETADVQKMYEQLMDEGIEFVAEPTIATHGVMASFLDPSGNRIDLYQPTHQKVREALEKGAKFCDTGLECGDNTGGCCKSS